MTDAFSGVARGSFSRANLFTHYQKVASATTAAKASQMMRYVTMSTLLVLTAGLTWMPTGPLLANDAGGPAADCGDRLARIERRLASSDVGERTRENVRLVIDGARTLDRLGDAKRCIDLAEQLDGLMERLATPT